MKPCTYYFVISVVFSKIFNPVNGCFFAFFLYGMLNYHNNHILERMDTNNKIVQRKITSVSLHAEILICPSFFFFEIYANQYEIIIKFNCLKNHWKGWTIQIFFSLCSGSFHLFNHILFIHF